MKDGFVKVAAASPKIKVADPEYNADIIIDVLHDADKKGVKILVFPELCLTGCTCGDLLFHRVLLDAAESALLRVAAATAGSDMLVILGTPLAYGSAVYSCAVMISDGNILGVTPREDVATTRFTAGTDISETVCLGENQSPVFTTNMLALHRGLNDLTVAVEFDADAQSVNPPSARHAAAGATVIARLASFAETVTSTEDALLLLRADSRRMRCTMILAAPGCGESTTDNVYSGLCAVAENGILLAQNESGCGMCLTEADACYMTELRRGAWQNSIFGSTGHANIYFGRGLCETALTRSFSKHPHLPECADALPAYCERVIGMQVSALAKRLEAAHLDHCVVGISGGVDSTLAVMISAYAIKKMGLPAQNVIAVTMPCFGTSSRTKSNAVTVAERFGCEVRVVNISGSVLQHFDEIGHAHDDYSVAFENAQARMRTMVLMDIANKVNGIDVGTEDLSEFIDGWCTFNGDHISMYDVNVGLTKTQVRANVSHIAAETDDTELKAALYDVLDCPVTPELLPIHDDLIEQKSEDAVGSYSLQDFFTHKILVCGFTPVKTLRLAKLAYGDEFSEEELIRWLKSWCRRLFSQQFKRSCLMDGPAVSAFSVSPRNGLHMPSDAEAAVFLKELEATDSEVRS